MKIFSLCVLACGILSGCANMTTASSQAAGIIAVTDVKTKTLEASHQQNLPNVELTDEILFKVISAEIAFQRGDFATAFATTMAVAQQTHDPRLAKRAMEMALLAKQPLQALTAVRLWHQYSPDSDEATQYYLSFMLLENNWAEIKSILAPRLANAAPGERGLLILQTQRLLARSSNKEAVFNVLEELYQPYPDYFESHLALAQAAYASNNNVRALTEANMALRLNSTSQLSALTLAQVSPTPAAALKALAGFLAKNPAAYDVRRSYAGLLIEQTHYVEARHQYEILLAEKPEDPTNLYALGMLSLQLNDPATAEKRLTEFVRRLEAKPDEQHDPTSAYLSLSKIADARRDGVAALNWLGKIQSYNGKNAAYFNAQLRRALLTGKYESLEAALQFLHAITINPANSEEQIKVLQLEVELLRNAQHDQEAVALLQTALQKYPNNPDLLFELGMMAEKLNHLEEMETAFRRVIQISPESQHAYNALGYALADRNIRLTEARVLIEKALALAPNDAFILDSMGWLEFRDNHQEIALTFLQRAYQIRPEADIAVHIGEVLWSMGEQQKAKHFWKEAQQKDPDNAALKSTLKRFDVRL